ncbi:MAG: large protein [Chitinophagaceae bacterium]|nr:large protein [Chitinophagaceae bacterium]
MTTRKLLFTLFLISCFFKSFAQPGTLDASFNSTGINTFSFKQNISVEHVGASITDTLGNVYIVGTEFGDAALGTVPFIVKVLPSGKLDPAFGTKGKANISGITSGTFIPQAITLHPNGHIILAGYIVGGSPDYPCVMSLLSNGSADFSFPNGGYVSYTNAPEAAGSGAGFTAVQITKEGNIIATGSTGGSTSDFLVAALDQYGNSILFAGNNAGTKTIDFASSTDMATCSALDDTILYIAGNVNNSSIAIAALGTTTGNFITSFQGGYETLTNSGGDSKDSCAAIAITTDHSVILAGSATAIATGNRSFFAYKLDVGGAYQYSVPYNTPSSVDSKAYSIYLDKATSKMTLGGSVYDGVSGQYSWALVHADAATGAQDNALGIQNYTTINSSAFEGIVNIHKLKDGNFILSGTYHNPVTGVTDIKTKKVNSAGAAVTTYGSASEGTFWIIDRSSYVTDLAKRSDNKLWTCGNYKDVNNLSVPVIALLNSNGSFDTGFGGISGSDAGIIELHNILPSIISTGIKVGSIALQGNDLIVAGTYADTNLFVIRVKSDGTLDDSFNGNFKFNYLAGPNGKGAYAHQVLIQPDNKILVYGYLGGSLTVSRYNSDGSKDAGFGGGTGYYAQDSTDAGDYDILNLQLALQSDGKIVAVGNRIVPFTSSQEALAFRLNTNGTRDYTFASATQGLFTYNPGGANGVQYATSVCINSKGKILVGGFIQTGGSKARTEATGSGTNYLLLQVNPNGTLDTTFATHGAASLNENYETQGILGLQLENDNAIVATGVANNPDNIYRTTVLRFNASGSLDNTFNNQGHYAVSRGYPKKALILGGSLYVLGGDDKMDNSPNGYIAKLKLGTGPLIKTTYLALPNYINKFYGDKPFIVKPVTNSPAPIRYSVSGSTCATIDSMSGLVTLTCATINPPVTIRVAQAAVSGYTADTAYTSLFIARGIPTIVFDEQGAIVGEKFKLAFQTNYNDPALTYYTQIDPYYSPSFNLYSTDSLEVLAEGTATVTIYFSGTNNYEGASASALVHGYTVYVAPVASDDEITLISGTDNGAVIQVLANDQAFSGQINARSIDLDPSTPDVIDTIYVSPSLGLFYTDTLGAVHYVPFSGFIGSGSINYTIRDNHGQVSASAKISIAEKVLGEKPSLKATQLFTPNNDGLNDAFVIGYIDMDKTNSLKVYDRNGEELCTFSNYKNDWGGEMPNGKKAENGIYYYLFTEGEDGDRRELKGVVELRR